MSYFLKRLGRVVWAGVYNYAILMALLLIWGVPLSIDWPSLGAGVVLICVIKRPWLDGD